MVHFDYDSHAGTLTVSCPTQRWYFSVKEIPKEGVFYPYMNVYYNQEVHVGELLY